MIVFDLQRLRFLGSPALRYLIVLRALFKQNLWWVHVCIGFVAGSLVCQSFCFIL